MQLWSKTKWKRLKILTSKITFQNNEQKSPCTKGYALVDIACVIGKVIFCHKFFRWPLKWRISFSHLVQRCKIVHDCCVTYVRHIVNVCSDVNVIVVSQLRIFFPIPVIPPRGAWNDIILSRIILQFNGVFLLPGDHQSARCQPLLIGPMENKKSAVFSRHLDFLYDFL